MCFLPSIFREITKKRIIKNILYYAMSALLSKGSSLNLFRRFCSVMSFNVQHKEGLFFIDLEKGKYFFECFIIYYLLALIEKPGKNLI